MAAKTHRMAADNHAKGDHKGGLEHSNKAHGQSTSAHEASTDAHAESEDKAEM
jgi:hypothetical protein